MVVFTAPWDDSSVEVLAMYQCEQVRVCVCVHHISCALSFSLFLSAP